MKNKAITVALGAFALICASGSGQAQDILINGIPVPMDGLNATPPAQGETVTTPPPQSVAPQPQAQAPVPPTQYLQPVTKTTLTIGSQTFVLKGTVAMQVLPDGRLALVFTDPTDVPSNVEGFEATTLPDGRAALIKLPFVRQPLPPGGSEFIGVNGQATLLNSGTVDGKTDIATIPFRYKQTVRLKSDHTYRSIFGKEKVDIAAGTLGFNGGQFTSANRQAQMICLFSPSNPAYVWAQCFLKLAGSGPADQVRDVGPLPNVPLYYSASTYNYVESITMVSPLDIESGDFAIPHDFKLTLRVKFWVDGKPALVWTSEGKHVRDELLQPDKAGQFSLGVNGGKLIFKPVDGDTKKTIVEFQPKP